jgi:hypothetical protein
MTILYATHIGLIREVITAEPSADFVTPVQTRAAALANAATARIQKLVRRATLVLVDVEIYAQLAPGLRPVAQPSMCNLNRVGYRTRPRDCRGRFLPRSWLADAELFLPADRAWFVKPLTSTTER